MGIGNHSRFIIGSLHFATERGATAMPRRSSFTHLAARPLQRSGGRREAGIGVVSSRRDQPATVVRSRVAKRHTVRRALGRRWL